MDRHTSSLPDLLLASESDPPDRAAEPLICDLPACLPVTKEEIDAVFFHARDLIEALMGAASAPPH